MEAGRRRRVQLLGRALADLSPTDIALLARAADLIETAAQTRHSRLDEFGCALCYSTRSERCCSEFRGGRHRTAGTG